MHELAPFCCLWHYRSRGPYRWLTLLVKDPQIEVNNVAVASVSLQEIGLNVTLNVNNPNPIGITLKSVAFDVYYQQGDELGLLCGHGEGGGYETQTPE